MMKTYSELVQLKTFDERFNYLKLKGNVGVDTFGYDRYLNQKFYSSPEWRRVRDEIIIRDHACDLGLFDNPDEFEIFGKIYIHHINPLTQNDLINFSDYVLNPENLICCSKNTHNAIHYGESALIDRAPIIRTPNDTCPWRK